MTLSRRALFTGISALAAAAWLSACSSGADASTIERALTAHFGTEIAQSEPARRFAADLAAYLAKNPFCANPWAVCDSQDTRIVQSFLESTTFLASQASGADFDYITIFDPWTSPCASQLVAPINI